jgi:thimet oligopeptidase
MHRALAAAFTFTVLLPVTMAAQSTAANPALSAVDWHPKPAALRAQCDSALERTRRQIALAVSRPLPQRTLDNSLTVIEATTTNLGQEVSPLIFLYRVAPDSALRAASVDCDQKTTNFYFDFISNPDVYAAAQALAAQNAGQSPDDRKLIALYMESGKHAGAGLDSATRRHTTALFKELNDLQRDFGIALATDTSSIRVTAAGITGFPQQFVATLKRTPDGMYVVPVNEATSSLVMRNATNADTRERYYRADSRVGGQANVARLSRALILRDSLAHLMGVQNWATYQLQTKMARTPERVLAFLNEIDTNLLPKARADQAERGALKRASGDTTAYRPWDYAYYGTLLRKRKYALDEQEIREYFPVDRVVSGVLDIYSHLLGVRFAEILPADAWAPDVREFAVSDSLGRKTLGVVYLDLFPRPNKYNQFGFSGLRARIVRPDGTTDRTIGAIVGSWPTPQPGKPALLSHDDVVTFFHEFGHLMAGTFATSPYGTNLNLRQDFVEAPSQMLENWMWQPEVLRLVSRSVKTGQPLPKALIDRMIAAKHMSDGINWTRQVFYAMYDMTLASSPPTIDVTKTWNDLLLRVTAGEAVPGGFPEASFGHLMGGYDAGYYAYLWSRVYAQDLFTRFEKEGVLNPKTGIAYRRAVLEPGGLREPDDLLRDFLGRPLNYDAFYRDVGIMRH